ncbi:MAG: hypothetical protein ABI678_00715 [Kofleriaceae bacterium]
MRRWIWMLVACGACRQVFGIDEPAPLLRDSGRPPGDTSSPFPDSAGTTVPGLRMHVLAGAALWSGADTSWTKTMNHPTASEDLWLGTGPDDTQLAFDGADANGVFTVWLEGEVYVAGTEQLQLGARDFAFVSMDLFGSGLTFIDVASSTNGMIDSQGAPVPGANWYPVRVGWTSMTGHPSLDILHKLTTDTMMTHYNATNLRH